MGFAGVYRAVYGYSSASDQELSLKENDLLYLLETADDGWWTVKKRVPGAASEEPEGIVPHNYIEPAKPEGGRARALYSYEQQTGEELTFSEGTVFDIYATDGDWVLVGIQAENKFGFVPNNYIELVADSARASPKVAVAADSQQQPPPQQLSRQQPERRHPEPSLAPVSSNDSQPPRNILPQRTNILTDENAPPRPSRPSHAPPSREFLDRDLPEEPPTKTSARSDEPKHMKWPIIDISARRRIAKTLVVAPTFVTLINDDGGGNTQKWDVHDIQSYSSEKKHVFLDLDNPVASLELKATSQTEADHIVASLGQIVGAGRGGGLEEVLAAAKSTGHKQGQIILDFKAANSRELSVSELETVFVINDTDKDWWLVRNVRGKEGLVPRKFVHVDKKDGKISDLFRNKKQKDRHRDREMEREHNSARSMARELDHEKAAADSRNQAKLSRKRSTHENRPLPDGRKMRLWVDRSGTFKVDAQLLGCSDGKVHLHKANGVKIAVPVSKLSFSDVEYVESVTGVNLSDDKPLVKGKHSHEMTRHSSEIAGVDARNANEAVARNDTWLSFFLSCGVDPQNANRYAKNFTRDNMDESTLSDINSSVLRTLGLREGDILRVNKKINEKLGRVQNPDGGLYSNEGGALQNNTGVTTPAAIDNQVWNQSKSPEPTSKASSVQPMPTNTQAPPQQVLQPQQTAARQVQPQQMKIQPTQAPVPTGSLADLLGISPAATGNNQVSPALTGALSSSTTGVGNAPNAVALQAQKTAEAQLAAQQRQTQHQILRQQAELQKEQIRLLKEQQEQLRRQQDELVQIQKTGSQLNPLGPFATGVAQQSTYMPSAASVLSAPQPPQPRGFQGVQPQFNQQPQFTSQTSGMFIPQQQTGPFAQPPMASQLTTTSFGHQTTEPFTQSQTTGPFSQQFTAQRTGPFTQPQNTGPFNQQFTAQRTGPFVQPQTTGPFVQSQPTGPFANVGPSASLNQSQPTGPFSVSPTAQQQPGGFSNAQASKLNAGYTGTQPPSGIFSSFGSNNSMSTPQPNITGQLSGLHLTGNTTGPFSQQNHVAQPSSSLFGQQQQLQQRTGPFQQTPASQPSTTFGNQFQPVLQHTGPFQTHNNTNPQMQMFGGFSTGQSNLQHTPAYQTPIQNPNGVAPQQQPWNNGTSFPQTTGGGIFQNQPAGPFQQPAMNSSVGQQGFPQTSFGQTLPQQGNQIPLQSQATGFGFGNQPQQQQQQQARANFSMASASNPFGL